MLTQGPLKKWTKQSTKIYFPVFLQRGPGVGCKIQGFLFSPYRNCQFGVLNSSEVIGLQKLDFLNGLIPCT